MSDPAWQESTARIGIVIAAKNEEVTVGPTVLAAHKELQAAGLDHEVIVVDDGSSDHTADAAAAAGARVLSLPGRGQGASLRDGYAAALAAGATIVVSMDADGQHRAEDLLALIIPVLNGDVAVASGSRVLGAAEGTVAVRAAGIRFFALLLSLLSRRRVTDPSCGFRALNRSALGALDLHALQFHTAEVLGQCYGLGLSLREVPVTIDAREVGVSHKPPTLAYAVGFGSMLVRSFINGRRRRRTYSALR